MAKLFQLRSWAEGDIASLVENANNKKIFDNLRDAFPHPYTEQDAMLWIEKNMAENPATHFAIDVRGKAIGSIGVTLKADVYRMNAEIGYWIGEDYWNLGIATEAVQEVTGYTFKTFHVMRIFACIFAHNAASRRVVEKAGFKLEAVLKNSVIKNGVIMDEYIYSLHG